MKERQGFWRQQYIKVISHDAGNESCNKLPARTMEGQKKQLQSDKPVKFTLGPKKVLVCNLW